MNKKEAVAYAQITLDYMQSSKYTGQINPDTFAVEMKQSFKLYPNTIVIGIAASQSFARKKLQAIKDGSDIIEWRKWYFILWNIV